MKKLLAGIIISLIGSSYAIDLYEAYQKSLIYNADYLKALALNQADNQSQEIAQAQLLPQINATGTFSENYFVMSGVNAYYYQPIYQIKLNWPLVDFNKFAQYDKSKFNGMLADAQLIDARKQLLVKTAQAYFDVLFAEDNLQTTQMTKSALSNQLAKAKLAFVAGNVTRADIDDANSAYTIAIANEVQNQNDLINKKNIFYSLTGTNPDQIQPLVESINLAPLIPANPDIWIQTALANNDNIKIANEQLQMAKEDISIARASHLPTINLTAQYQYQDTAGLDQTNANAQLVQLYTSVPGSPLSSYGIGAIGLQINLPLYSGGGISASSRQAIANFESAQYNLIDIKRTITQNVANSYSQVQNGLSLIEAQTISLSTAKNKLDADKLGYNVGIRSSTDLISSQKNYYQSFTDYQASRYQYLMAQINLAYLSGRLDDEFLRSINSNIKN